MRRDRGIVWTLAALLWAGAPAAAQTPAVALPIVQCAVPDPRVIPALTSAYDAGDADAFGRTAASVIGFVRQCARDIPGEADRASIETLDLKRDYVVLAWPTLDQFSEWALYWSIVHAGAGVHDRALAGVGRGSRARLFQILVSPSALDRLAGVYVSTRGRDPLESQLPSAAAAIAAPLLAALAAQQGTIGARREALSPERAAPSSVPSSWASVARVDLPFRRASIQVELRGSIAPAVPVIGRQVEALRSRLVFLEVPHVPCATALAGQFAEALQSLASACADRPRLCLEAAHAQLSSKYESQAPLCLGQTAAETTRNLQGLQRVDTAFRKYAGELDATVLPTTLRLENTPPSRFSLGVVTGYLAFARTSAARVKISGRVITPDPIGRQISMVVVNGAFRSYDPARVSPGWRERTRWFAGAVVAPDVGAGGGFSLLLVRGLALNVGGALLAVRIPGQGETIGRAPVNASSPFGVGGVRGGFVGLSYNFK
jgi:hypothetical protein